MGVGVCLWIKAFQSYKEASEYSGRILFLSLTNLVISLLF